MRYPLVKNNDILKKILLTKENRVIRQRELINKFRKPIISFTLNIPGPDKNKPEYLILFKEGLKAIHKMVRTRLISQENYRGACGAEALIVVDGNPEKIKKDCITIEETHPLGRLFDIDVIRTNYKKISRKDIKRNKRKCLICDDSAVHCIVSKRHTLNELTKKINTLQKTFEANQHE